MGYALRSLILAIGLHLVRSEGTCDGCEDGSVLLQKGPGKAEEESLVAAGYDEDPDETLEGYKFEDYVKEFGKTNIRSTRRSSMHSTRW